MIDYEHFNLFWQGSVDKQWKIEYSGGLIRNRNELFSQSIEITESLCSEQKLRFGCCEASRMKFKVANIFTPLTGEWLTVSVVIGHNEDLPLMIGRYKVISDKPTADRKWRDVIAYDAMEEITSADMAAWYKKILPGKQSTVSMRQFRESFLRHFNLEWVVPRGGLVNDEMVVERTIDPEQISGRDVITAICEINGCFGHIGRDGKFHYIYLPQAIEGLYPANDLYPDRAPEHLAQAKTGHLYPQDPKGISIVKGNYITAHYEDFRTKSITILQIRQEENDIGKVYPEREITEDDNCYIIQDNFLVYGKSDEQLTVIAQNIYSKITDITYRPFDADCRGNPCLEVGDPVRFTTRYELIESYILERTLKGIQALRDSYRANGVEKYTEEVNGINKSIIQLKGKTNVLIRTVDETRLEMKDIENGLSNEIKATAGEIRAELNNTKEGLRNEISVTAAGLRGEITDTKNGLQTQITANASGLSAEITRAQGAEGNLSTRITATAGELSSEISRATAAEGTLSSRISQKPDSISMSVSNGSASAGITISLKNENGETVGNAATGTIEMKGLVTFTDLSESSSVTQIYGGNIKTHSITADKITVTTLEEINRNLAGFIVGNKELYASTENGTFTIGSNNYIKSIGTQLVANGQTYNKPTTSISFGGLTSDFAQIKGGTIAGFIIKDSGFVYTSGSDHFEIKRNYILSKNTTGSYAYETRISTGSISTNNLRATGGQISGVKISGGEISGVTINDLNISDGTVGGFTVGDKKIYYGKSYLSSMSSGTYIGSDGVASLQMITEQMDIRYGNRSVFSASANNNKISFFGATAVAKVTVSTISSTSGATSASNATKINEIINALKKYGLL